MKRISTIYMLSPLITLIMTLTMVSCSKDDIHITKALNEEINIFPDYKDIIIPCNIAPMNFSVRDSDNYCVIIKGEKNSFWVHSDDGLFEIPQNKWKALLKENKGKKIAFTIARQQGNEWYAYNSFTMEVANDSIDKYLVYRLIPPYEQWLKMGICQRNLENYEQEPIYENRLTDYNCVNCHSFPMQNPDKMLFHMRAKDANGTVLINQGKVQKINTKTPETISNLVYPYWHPSGKYVAASTNIFHQSYFYNHDDRVEVYDINSDVVVYDIENRELLSCNVLNDKHVFETFPSFSPDGKSLYFCTTPALDSVPDHISKMKYSLCRIDFNPETRTFGAEVDTLFNANKDGRSINFPRVSPDGKYMIVTLTNYCNFSINHKDADLFAIDMKTGKLTTLDMLNSDEAESYHSWSHNSRWIVYSSRRIDGLYTRPFFSYIDKNGVAHKPFLLPQKNPVKFYSDFMFAYNIPEFVKDKVKVNPHKIAEVMSNRHAGTNLTFKE
ncbi:MAG: TolB family protein [Phocaeicola sp.]|uniref:TolB family protein n=1 Tax=Phocaeicola sp. TaxID=2773926 RepID=UPI003FA0BB26